MLVNNCHLLTAIDFIDKDKLFVVADTGLPIVSTTQVEVPLLDT